MSTRKRRDDDFAREIRAHIDSEAARLIEEGMEPGQARDAARRAFGNVTRAEERFYERSRLLWIDRLRQDVRCGLRNIRRYPVAALVAVVSLAGGIGATTVTLMVRDILFRKARFYTLTKKGRKELVHEEGEWRRIASAIMRVLGPASE